MSSPTGVDDVPRGPFKTVLNFRDVGETTNILHGSPILRPGVLFRSAQPSTGSEEDLAALTDTYKIRSVLDLRTQSELDVATRARSHPDTTADFSSVNAATTATTTTSINIPHTTTHYASLTGRAFQMALFRRLSWRSMGRLIYNMATGNRLAGIAIIGSEAMAPRGLLGLGIDTLTTSTAEVKSIFVLLAQDETYPILVHCTHGKDRTGTVVILILLLCGVEVDAIRADYMATERELAPDLDNRLKEIRALALSDEFVGCPPGFVDGLVAWLGDKHGGIEGYLQSIGVDRETREKVKKHIMQL
ncbi:protein-tyrosine phosphatase-like protein [Schizophyllum amplum]|uniref:Protein-tyrosine phosphatase-like protein n=1 Tax=Schizophyllum amplum TaxID=97359 RepID=A0A550CTS1_9AGAR|nr:protein-tyrosine phosphatase-like protein [Auriculariopsis ampla]